MVVQLSSVDPLKIRELKAALGSTLTLQGKNGYILMTRHYSSRPF